MAMEGREVSGANAPAGGSIDPKKLPPGVVLGKDGKPCRACSSKMAFSAFVSQHSKPNQQKSSGTIPGMMAGMMAGGAGGAAATTNTNSQSAASVIPARSDCPPDVEELGRSTWTLLHSIAATYPSAPTTHEQADLRGFMSAFSRLYPCWSCAEDFQKYMAKQQMPVGSRDEFGKWLCEAHNAVNRKLGKQAFDCARWEERWRDGWKDGRCD